LAINKKNPKFAIMNDEQYIRLLLKQQSGQPLTDEEKILLQQRADLLVANNTPSDTMGAAMVPNPLDLFSFAPTTPQESVPQMSDEERYRSYLNKVKTGETRTDEELEWANNYFKTKREPGDFKPTFDESLSVEEEHKMLGYKPKQQRQRPQANPWDINNIPLIYPGGTDLSTELYSLGRGLGMEKGTKGRGAMIAGGAGAAILGGTRDVLSGLGYEKQQNLVRDWYRARQQDNTYTPVSQTRNTNNTGGFDFKYGGEFKSYEDGGKMTKEEFEKRKAAYERLAGEKLNPQELVAKEKKDSDGNTLYKDQHKTRQYYHKEQPLGGRSMLPVEGKLTEDELKFLAHKWRGIYSPNNLPSRYPVGVGEQRHGIKGQELSPEQVEQLRGYMQSTGFFTDVAQGMPNLFGNNRGTNNRLFQDGGEMMQQQMAPEQQEMLQQVQMFVVEMMQQGTDPQQIVQELVQNGVPQEQAVMLVEQVMMQMQQQQVPQEMVPQQAIPQEQPMQPQVGQEVSFKYGGKKVSGKIKKIENGKIYL